MPDSDRAHLRTHPSIASIGEAAWNALAPADHPFTRYGFLSALEDSGCVGGETGWRVLHLTLDGPDGTPEAALPLYLKSHSMGEYVFDQAWARAYEQAGGRYYPKLLAAIPFTPCQGPRLLARDAPARATLAAGLVSLCDQLGLSSAHVNFVTETDAPILKAAGLLKRRDVQFHFRNPGYRDFEDFLSTLSSSRRKTIRRERRDAVAAGIEIEWLKGSDITEAQWDAYFRFYLDTGSRKWGRPYLNRAFFSLLSDRMGDAVRLVLAKRGGNYIAGALNLNSHFTLYGRHWGAIEEHPFLHFELCYYQAIDFAIRHGLTTVEAGAQGEHKIARGYVPVETSSWHYLRDPGFHAAVARYLAQEGDEVAREAELLKRYAPFKRG